MKVDHYTLGRDLDGAARDAREAEERACDGWFTGETSHDPFVLTAAASQATQRIAIGTGIAVAFARTPMDIAYSANDLQLLSGGRFVLGLGSQVRAHVERRFGTSWSRPAARMREFVLALRAIWTAWQNETTLDFDGDFYHHTLMTPMFSPGLNPFGVPRILLAAVGPRMTEVAAEVADGVLCHAFTTPAHLRHSTLPAIERGLLRSGRSRNDFEVAVPVFLITADDADQFREVERAVRKQLAFYASTPTYRRVLEAHGWTDLQPELNTLARAGRWEEMADLITPEVLDAFAVRAEPAEAGRLVRARVDGIADRLSLFTPYRFDEEMWMRFLSQVREGEG